MINEAFQHLIWDLVYDLNDGDLNASTPSDQLALARARAFQGKPVVPSTRRPYNPPIERAIFVGSR